MRNFILFIIVIGLISPPKSWSQLTSSNLPIVVIDTDGRVILNEPKISAKLKIFDSTNGENNWLTDTPSFEGHIGIELRGQSSLFLFPKNGFGIETRNADGSNLDTAIMGMPRENDWVIHSPYSDKSLMRNALAYQIAKDLMRYAPRVRMAEMILNDDYYGVILWTEKIKRDRNRVDVSRLDSDENEGDQLTGGYILKFDKGEPREVGWRSAYPPIPGRSQRAEFLYHYPKWDAISPAQKDYIKSWMTNFEDILMSDNYDHPSLGYSKYIDVESFIQIIIINELSRNVDGYRLSTYMYKDRDSEGGKLFIGPAWDYNLAWGNADYCNGSSTWGWALNFNGECPQDQWLNHVWWNRLMAEPAFRQTLKDRWFQRRQDVLSDENLVSKVEYYSDLLKDAQKRNFERWPVLGTYIWPNNYVGNSYSDEIHYIRDWILERVAWLDDAFGNLTTNVEDVSEVEGLRLFPNPTSEEVFIDAQIEVSEVELFDIHGQVVLRQQLSLGINRIDLREIGHSGLFSYLIRQPGGNLTVGKVMIVK